MRTSFACISKDSWSLASGIDHRRRLRLLHGSTFEKIVGCIAETTTLSLCKREKLDSRRLYRVVIILKMNSAMVDLFYNSAYGYRAQYYHNVKNGERANNYAIKKLTPRIKELLTGRGKLTCPWWWVERSLSSPDAKLWIHQGRWLRTARRSDRNIYTWRNRLHISPSTSGKKKLVRGSLCPKDETQIVVKGGFLTLAGAPNKKKLKPHRGKDIHDFGFT